MSYSDAKSRRCPITFIIRDDMSQTGHECQACFGSFGVETHDLSVEDLEVPNSAAVQLISHRKPQ